MDAREVAHHAHEHGGWVGRTIESLIARVEALEKENERLRDAIGKARQAPQETRREAIAPDDATLLAFLRERPSTLREICERFGVAWCHSPVCPRSDGATDGYTEECRAIRNQLQRLRRARKIRCESTRWEVR